MAEACPSSDRLRALVDGTLTSAEFEVVSDHLEVCAACEAVVERLEASAVGRVGRSLEAASTAGEDGEACEALIDRMVSESRRSWGGVERSERSTWQVNLTPGAELGKYQIERLVGRGGMACVYAARHRRLDRMVALKVLAPGDQDRQRLARFEREVQTVARLKHPNLVSVVDADEAGGLHFFVMPLLRGLDLEALVARCGPLPIAAACEIVRQTALGLQAAHRAGVIHRDVKPSNIMLTVDDPPHECVKLLDLGLACSALPGAAEGITDAGQLLGTLDYLAPEQATAPDRVDARTDLHGLGATLFRLLTGRTPHEPVRTEPLAVRIQTLAACSPPSLGELRPDAPPRLVRLVDSLLAVDSSERPATSDEVAGRLTELLDEAGGGADLEPLRTVARTAAEQVEAWGGETRRTPTTATALAVTLRGARRGRRAAGWGLAIVLVIAAAAAAVRTAPSLGLRPDSIDSPPPAGGSTSPAPAHDVESTQAEVGLATTGGRPDERLEAPDSKARPEPLRVQEFHDDQFHYKDDDWLREIRGGVYVVEHTRPPPGESWWAWPMADHKSPGEAWIDLRIVAGRGWLVVWQNDALRQGFQISQLDDELYFGPSPFNAPTADGPALRRLADDVPRRPLGQWSRLRVRVEGGRVDVMFNDRRYAERLDLGFDLGDHRVCLGLAERGPGGAPNRVEFARVLQFAADAFPFDAR